MPGILWACINMREPITGPQWKLKDSGEVFTWISNEHCMLLVGYDFGRDYLYSELVNPIFTKDGDNVKVKVAVKFLDNQTKATLVSQYELVLHKDSNWKIVG